MYDIFFISYNESNALTNLNQLKKKSDRVQHLHGIVGIANAYSRAAELSTTEHFFIVDGDNFIQDSFNFEHVNNLSEHPTSVHVWRCLNPVNQLIYGYGGVKLFPKSLFNKLPESYLDFSMTLAKSGYFVQKDVASETHFNATAFEAWRGGFRECAKLSLELENKFTPMTQERVKTWTQVGEDALNGRWAIIGARMGRKFHHNNRTSPELLKSINDFQWLESEFNKYKDQDPKVLLNQLGEWKL